MFKPIEQNIAAQNTTQAENTAADIKPNETYTKPTPEKPVSSEATVQDKINESTEQK